MSEEIKQEEIKNINNPNKTNKNRIITFICGGVGIVALILFAIFVFNPSKKVSFITSGGTKIESIKIENNKLTNIPENPKKDYYDFMGWYDNKECNGKAIDLSEYEFEKAITLYAKWTLHKYIVKIYNLDTGEEIIFKDEEKENPITFYITARHEEATEDEVTQYTIINSEEDLEKAKKEMNNIALSDEFDVKYITNLHKIDEKYRTSLLNKAGYSVSTISRKELDPTIKYDEEGNEIEFLKLYIKDYQTEE